jgi:hypothetical protein
MCTLPTFTYEIESPPDLTVYRITSLFELTEEQIALAPTNRGFWTGEVGATIRHGMKYRVVEIFVPKGAWKNLDDPHGKR